MMDVILFFISAVGLLMVVWFVLSCIEYSIHKATLRDRLAAAALTGLLANPTSKGTETGFLQQSYRLADVALAEREKENGK